VRQAIRVGFFERTAKDSAAFDLRRIVAIDAFCCHQP